MYAWQLAAAGIVTSFLGSKASAKAGEEAAEAQQNAYEIETHLKMAAVAAQTESILAAKDENYDRTVQRMSAVTREAMVNRGRLAASMGESGIAGNSVSNLFLQTFAAEAQARGQEIYNLSSKNKQANRDIRSAQAGLQINTRPANYDSTADTLKFASDALSIASNFIP